MSTRDKTRIKNLLIFLKKISQNKIILIILKNKLGQPR